VAAAEVLQRQYGHKAYVFDEGALVHEFYKAGFTIPDIHPDFIVVGDS